MATSNIDGTQSTLGGTDKPATTLGDVKKVAQPNGSILYQTTDGLLLDASSLALYAAKEVNKSLNGQLSQKKTEMATKNQRLAAANDILVSMRNKRPSGTDGSAVLSADVKKWFHENMPKVTVGDNSLNQGEWDKLSEDIKSRIDEMNATSQTDSLETDALVKHSDADNDMISNIQKMISQVSKQIIDNMRVE